MARDASWAADWIEPICSAISSVAFAVLPGKDFTSTATTANPFPDFPGARRFDGRVERKQIGLPGNRLDEADDLPDRVAAFPNSVIVVTVR